MAKTTPPKRSKPRKPSAKPTRRAGSTVPVKKPKAPAKRASHAARQPAVQDQERAFPLEIDPKRVEEGLAKLKEELVHWANKGRYTRVRFKFRGKQLLPDIPLAAVAAAEGLTFYWAGLLRALVFNAAGRSLFDVELVNDSEARLEQGKQALLSGDIDRALEHFREAIAMERDNPRAHLNLGVALKLQGKPGEARSALLKARDLDPHGPVGKEAERLLSTVSPPLLSAHT
jgi:tetratricopeptide (TPR) repeat protein